MSRNKKSNIKTFFFGLFMGYLVTSVGSLNSPPTFFWVLLSFTGIIYSLFLYAKYRFNDDISEGEF